MARVRFFLAFFIVVSLAGCASLPPEPRSMLSVLRGEEFIVHRAMPGDTWASLAETYLKDRNREWLIADFNKTAEVAAGQEIIIPLAHPNPTGIYPSGYQTVTILCYHRFGPHRAKMVITGEDFDAQMAYLAKHGYRVVPLSSIHAFLKGKEALPQRAVVITIDDGYRSSYSTAFPILKKYNFPATLFIYSDFVGSGDALGWKELREMTASGLVDVQPHSKTHASMVKRPAGEAAEAYRKKIEEEIRVPGQQIGKMLGLPLHTFAYPFGDTNELIVSQLKSAGYDAGVTVQAGGNPAFAYPFRLRRTMIYGDRDMGAFIKSLRVFTAENLKSENLK
jgi:peptidoglycan/xylan/chitin deacetylase (PgdA/CDA1 family)